MNGNQDITERKVCICMHVAGGWGSGNINHILNQKPICRKQSEGDRMKTMARDEGPWG